MAPHPIRERIGHLSLPQDRLWLVTIDDSIEGLTEYNQEITGTTPKLSWARRGTFHWFRHECLKNGWELKADEDRFDEKT